MIFPPIFELSLVGVADPNVANLERLVIRPTQEINLGQFGVLIGYRRQDSSIVPIWDQFYWFGEVVISPPSWIVLYTGKGDYNVATQSNGEKVYNFYWNKVTTVFQADSYVPVLIRLGGVAIGPLLQPPRKAVAAQTPR